MTRILTGYNGFPILRGGKLQVIPEGVESADCTCCGGGACVYNCCSSGNQWKCAEGSEFATAKGVAAYITITAQDSWQIEYDAMTVSPGVTQSYRKLVLSGMSVLDGTYPLIFDSGPGISCPTSGTYDPADCGYRTCRIYLAAITNTCSYTHRISIPYLSYDTTDAGSAILRLDVGLNGSGLVGMKLCAQIPPHSFGASFTNYVSWNFASITHNFISVGPPSCGFQNLGSCPLPNARIAQLPFQVCETPTLSLENIKYTGCTASGPYGDVLTVDSLDLSVNTFVSTFS